LFEDVSINIIDLQEKILSSYDREIADYATDFFKRANINCILNTQVKEVKRNSLIVADKNTGEEREIPCGMSVWCSGIKLNPICEKIQNSLPEGSQPNVRSLSADKAMRVKGSDGSIFGLGDCVTVERPKSMAKAQEIYAKACKCDEDGNCELQINLPTAIKALEQGGKDFPHLKEMAKSATLSIDVFKSYTQKRDEMTMSEFMKMCEALDNELRAFPATAQVAKQQGNYLAEVFNSAKENGFEALQDPNMRFNYEHKGSLAYIGKDSAVADIPGFTILKGLAAGLVWKSFETISQVSINNVFKVGADIVRTKIFGRDISRLL
jgi:NADH:ubiquinone reductase (non-electrogenic)